MPRRGLTLIETLLAGALLAMALAACLPWWAQVARASRHVESAVPADDLEALAAAVIEDPDAFGMAGWSDAVEPIEMAWPDGPHDRTVSLRLLEPADANIERAWLVVECDGRRVFRCLPREPEPEEPS